MKSFSIFIFICVIKPCFSQDIIYFKDGTEIQSVISEVLSESVKYKRFDNKQGPTYNIDKSKIFKIKYQNGTQDVFNSSVVSSPSAIQVTSNNKIDRVLASKVITYKLSISPIIRHVSLGGDYQNLEDKSLVDKGLIIMENRLYGKVNPKYSKYIYGDLYKEFNTVIRNDMIFSTYTLLEVTGITEINTNEVKVEFKVQNKYSEWGKAVLSAYEQSFNDKYENLSEIIVKYDDGWRVKGFDYDKALKKLRIVEDIERKTTQIDENNRKEIEKKNIETANRIEEITQLIPGKYQCKHNNKENEVFYSPDGKFMTVDSKKTETGVWEIVTDQTNSISMQIILNRALLNKIIAPIIEIDDKHIVFQQVGGKTVCQKIVKF